MNLLHYVAYFFGSLFLTNAIPHGVSGLMGRAFQSPFASPPGVGLSSSRLNVVWSFVNLSLGYALVWHVGEFDLRNLAHAATVGAGGLLGGLYLASRFGRFHGGNDAVKQTSPS